MGKRFEVIFSCEIQTFTLSARTHSKKLKHFSNFCLYVALTEDNLLHVLAWILKSWQLQIRECNLYSVSTDHDLEEWGWRSRNWEQHKSQAKGRKEGERRVSSHWPRYCSNRLAYFHESCYQPCKGHRSYSVCRKDWEVRWLQQDHSIRVRQSRHQQPASSESKGPALSTSPSIFPTGSYFSCSPSPEFPN